MNVLTTYLDASGTRPEHLVYSVAGFFADAPRWDAFNFEWAAALGDVKAFHMTDFSAERGAFSGWSGDQREELMSKLLACISRHTLGSVAFGISHDMYEANISQDVHRLFGRSPYFFLFMNLVVGIQHELNTYARFGAGNIPSDWQMEYILADGDQGTGAILQAGASKKRNAWLARREMQVKSITKVMTNKPYPALQAADILAFETRSQIGRQQQISGLPPARWLPAIERIGGVRSWGFYEHRHHFVHNVDVIQRSVFGKSGTELLTW